jgi:hypothetical protein
MKTLFLALAVLSVGSVALADGFECQTIDSHLSVNAYNHTKANQGTRTGATMVLADNSQDRGTKTIAKFSHEQGNLVSTAGYYVATVKKSEVEEESIDVDGILLTEIDTLTLSVDFQYSAPVKNGAPLKGTLKIKKLTGERSDLALDCTRYLKNDE